MGSELDGAPEVHGGNTVTHKRRSPCCAAEARRYLSVTDPDYEVRLRETVFQFVREADDARRASKATTAESPEPDPRG